MRRNYKYIWGTQTYFNSLIHPKKILFLFLIFSIFKITFASSDGSECQVPQGCTCSMKATLEYLDSKAVVPRRILTRDPDVVLHRIQEYQCIQLDPLPNALQIKWDDMAGGYKQMKRRKRIRRSQKENFYYSKKIPGQSSYFLPPLPPMKSLDSKVSNYKHNLYNIDSDQNHRRIRNTRQAVKPVGYPSNDLFAEVIPRLPQKSQHQYIPLGSQANLHCFNPQEYIEERVWIERKFNWFHSDGREVSAPEMSIDKHTGDLTLYAVQLSDSDVYNCQVTYIGEEDSSEVTELPQVVPNYHQLDVVAEPIPWLRFAVIYTSERCNQDELKMIQDSVIKWIHKYVCHFCPVRNNSVSCVTQSGSEIREEGDFRNVRIRFAMSTMGLEHQTSSFASYSDSCSLNCVESLHLKILQIARNSLEKLFRLEIDLESSQGGNLITFSSQPETIDSDLSIGCPTGFSENYKLCFPCPAGYFSPDGNTECLKCSLGHFQPTPGSAICFHCPHGYSTAGEASVAEYECKTEYFISAIQTAGSEWLALTLMVSAILIPIILIVCLIPYFFPNSTLGKWFASCSCCGPDPDFQPLEDSSNPTNINSNGKSYTRLQNYEEGGTTSGEDEYNSNDNEINRNKKNKNSNKKEHKSKTRKIIINKSFSSGDESIPKKKNKIISNSDSKLNQIEKTPLLKDRFTIDTEVQKTPKTSKQENQVSKLKEKFKSNEETGINEMRQTKSSEVKIISKPKSKETTYSSDSKLLRLKSFEASEKEQRKSKPFGKSELTQTSDLKLELKSSKKAQTSIPSKPLPVQTQTSVKPISEQILSKDSTQNNRSVKFKNGQPETKLYIPDNPSYSSIKASYSLEKNERESKKTFSSEDPRGFGPINVKNIGYKLEQSILNRKNPAQEENENDKEGKPMRFLLPPWGHPKYQIPEDGKNQHPHMHRCLKPKPRISKIILNGPPPPPPPLPIIRSEFN